MSEPADDPSRASYAALFDGYMEALTHLGIAHGWHASLRSRQNALLEQCLREATPASVNWEAVRTVLQCRRELDLRRQQANREAARTALELDRRRQQPDPETVTLRRDDSDLEVEIATPERDAAVAAKALREAAPRFRHDRPSASVWAEMLDLADQIEWGGRHGQ